MKDDITLGLHLDDSKARAKGQKFAKDMSGLKIEPSLSLGKITTDFTKFEQSLDAATARVVAFTATTSLLYGVGSAFKRLTQDAIQIESVMARIQSIFGSTAAETKQFQSAIFGLANDVGLSFFQVAEAAEEFSRQGLSLNKTLEATRAAAVVAKLSGAELKGVIEGLTATLSTFNDGTLDYIQVANKLVALDSAFATSAAGITEGLKRVSGVAVQAGLSFDETAAAITSLKQVTGRSEAVIGNSLKSIFTSLQTEKVQKDLATLGVETKDASGEFRNLVEVLSDLSKVYGTLGDAQKTVIAQRIGKTYQANAFQGILRTFETGDYEKALATSKNAGSSAEDRLEKLNQTTQSALQRFSNNITQLGGNLGEKLGKPLLDTVVGYMNSAVEAGNKIFGGSGLGDALVGGLRNVLEGPGVVILTFSVAKLLTRIIKESGQAVKSIAGLSGAKENILRIDQFITTNLSEQNKVELERIKTLTSVAAQQKAILDLMNRQLVTQEKMRSQGGLVKDYGITSLQSLGPAAASKAAKKIPNRGKGELPEVNKAILREAIDIRNGVGGARITASPMVKTLNLGKGPEKVVVNSDEKIVKNFAGSGQDAVINREMMSLASGNIPDPDKLSRNIIERIKRENLKRRKGIYGGLQAEIPLPISQFSPLTSGIKGLENYKFSYPLGANYFRPAGNETIESARQEKFAKEFEKEFQKNLDQLLATTPVSFETSNKARRGGRPEVRQPSNLKYKPTGNFYDFSGNEFLRSVSPFSTDRQRNVFAGGRGVFLQNNPAPITTYGVFKGGSQTESISQSAQTITEFRKKTPTPLLNRGVTPPPLGGIIPNIPPSKPRIPSASEILPFLGDNYTRGAFSSLPPLPGIPSAKDILPALGGNYTRGGYATLPPLKAIVPKASRPNFSFNTQKGARVASIDDGIRIRSLQDKIDSISNIIETKGFSNLSGSAQSYFKQNKNLFDDSVVQRYESRSLKNRAKRAFGGFGSEKVLGAGFAATFIGGAAAEGFKTKDGEDTQTSRAISGISQSVGIGSSLAIFGKIPGVLGLAAGAVVGLNDAFGENIDNLNGLSKKHDNLVTKYRDEANAIDSYRQNFETLSDAISSGSKKAAIEARKNLTAALGSISDPGFVSELSSASSVSEVSRVANRISEQRARELAGSEALSSVAKLRQENRQSLISQTGIFGFGGGRNYAPDGSYEAISSQLIKSIDFSKFSDADKQRIKSGGFGVSDLDDANKKTLEIFSKRFKGEEIILKAIERRVLAEEESAKSVENLGKVIQRAQDFTNVISGSAQKASYSIFEKIIKSSLTSSLADISLQGAKPFTSEIAFAESQFAIDKSRRSQDLASKNAGLNASLIEKAQELTKGRNLDFGQLGKIQGAFSRFGETQDVGAFLKDFEGILGTDSKELVKFAQGQFLELKKLSAETAAGNQEADARQRVLIEELKRNQRAALFGGGLNKFDRGQASPGLEEILKGPKYNKFNDPTRPGFGLNERTGRKTFSIGEYAKEEAKMLDSNEGRYDKIIKRAQYLKESGYFGVEPTAETPQNLKDQRQKLLEQERKPLVEALIGKRQKFAKDLALSESGSYVSAINADSKRITGGIAITTEQKKVIADAIKSGSYDTAIGALDESTKNLTKDYGLSGKTNELGKIESFKTFLQQQKENASNIDLAAKEQANAMLPNQSIEGKSIDLLTDIKTEEIRANENLSAIASLMARQEAAASTDKRVSEYNVAAGDLESLKIQRGDNVAQYNEILSRIDKFDPSAKIYADKNGGGVSGMRSYLNESIGLNEKYGVDPNYIKTQHSFLSELRNIKSDDAIGAKIQEKQRIVDSFKDVQGNTAKDLVEKLGTTFGKISEKLDTFFGGDKTKTSKVDQNISLDINATVAGANILTGSDFKNEMASFISSYVTRKMGEIWKENTGNIMIEPPAKNTATA